MHLFLLSETEEQPGQKIVEYLQKHFPEQKIKWESFSGVKTLEEIGDILKEASQKKGIVTHAIIDSEMRAEIKKKAWRFNVPVIDLLESFLSRFFSGAGRFSQGWGFSSLHSLEQNYFDKMDAIEFAVRCDDGKDLAGLTQADIVLIGISRTSKTPLSIYLAHLGYKVANIPLVPEVMPPKELFSIPREKIVGLTIDPDILRSIRRERLKVIQMPAAEYSQVERIFKELEYGKSIMERLGCRVLEVTGRSLEELATLILQKGDF